MHAAHLDVRRTALAALAALILALAALAVAPALSDIHLGGGGGSAVTSAPAPAPHRMATPAWVKDPLASPIAELAAPSR